MLIVLFKLIEKAWFLRCLNWLIILILARKRWGVHMLEVAESCWRWYDNRHARVVVHAPILTLLELLAPRDLSFSFFMHESGLVGVRGLRPVQKGIRVAVWTLVVHRLWLMLVRVKQWRFAFLFVEQFFKISDLIELRKCEDLVLLNDYLRGLNETWLDGISLEGCDVF